MCIQFFKLIFEIGSFVIVRPKVLSKPFLLTVLSCLISWSSVSSRFILHSIIKHFSSLYITPSGRPFLSPSKFCKDLRPGKVC
jgi:hypothetical protein